MNRSVRVLVALSALALTACTPDQVRAWFDLEPDTRRDLVVHVVEDAAREFGVDADEMLALGQCESGLRPEAKNTRSTARGVFQYLDGTWSRARWRLYERGIDAAPYEEVDVWNPVAQARITANVIAEGGWWWECRRSR